MIKSELRRTLRARRAAFVHERGDASLHLDIFSNSLLNLLTNSSLVVSAYIHVGAECDVMASLLTLASLKNRLALPCANSKQDRLIFRKWWACEALETSPLGFEQPIETASQVTPDIILTPVLGFDRGLARLGQGAGHYDRAFEDFPDALRIGIAWSCQEVETIPCDPWDITLDAVMTEREWMTAPASRMDFIA